MIITPIYLQADNYRTRNFSLINNYRNPDSSSQDQLTIDRHPPYPLRIRLMRLRHEIG